MTEGRINLMKKSLNIDYTPNERLARIVDILAEGVISAVTPIISSITLQCTAEFKLAVDLPGSRQVSCFNIAFEGTSLRFLGPS